MNAPKLIFLTGKTGTGKTTLARQLQQDFNYAVIELDEVILALDNPHGLDLFYDIYRGTKTTPEVSAFITNVTRRISEYRAHGRSVIIEGSIAVPPTLQSIIADWRHSFLFIYLQPVAGGNYHHQIMSRFLATTPTHRNGLPEPFWRELDAAELANFYKSGSVNDNLEQGINTYVSKSIAEAAERLRLYQASFEAIEVIIV